VDDLALDVFLQRPDAGPDRQAADLYRLPRIEIPSGRAGRKRGDEPRPLDRRGALDFFRQIERFCAIARRILGLEPLQEKRGAQNLACRLDALAAAAESAPKRRYSDNSIARDCDLTQVNGCNHRRDFCSIGSLANRKTQLPELCGNPTESEATPNEYGEFG